MSTLVIQTQSQTEENMKKHLDKLRQELSSIRTNRASPSLLDGIRVKCYGGEVPVRQVAAVSLADSRTLEIKPWDPSVIAEIEKSIMASHLGVTPQNDGKSLRLSLPSLTEERRRELVKVVGKIVEQYRVEMRNERRLANEQLKKSEKAKEITEDDQTNGEQVIHKLSESYIKKVDELMAAKEKEIMEV
jgi:ribosome recycling factor